MKERVSLSAKKWPTVLKSAQHSKGRGVGFIQIYIYNSGFFFQHFFGGQMRIDPPKRWVFGPIFLSFFCKPLSFFPNHWVFQKLQFFFSKNHSILTIGRHLPVHCAFFRASIRQICSSNVSKNPPIVWVFKICLENPPIVWVFEILTGKSSDTLSFEAQNPLSFLRSWVFFRLSFEASVKKKAWYIDV